MLQLEACQKQKKYVLVFDHTAMIYVVSWCNEYNTKNRFYKSNFKELPITK